MVMIEEEVSSSKKQGFPQLKGYDYIEFYVGNAHQAAHFYRTAFGFTPVAYQGLETGARDRVSYVMEQRNIRLVLTSALYHTDPIAEHVLIHGDGVKDIAFTVTDAEHAFAETVRRGAQPIMEPTVFEDKGGQVVKATIAAYGDTVHSFIQRKDYQGNFFPDFIAIKNPPTPPIKPCLAAIDHVAISLEPGQLDQWVRFYQEVLGFHASHEEDIETQYSAMNSKVVQNNTGRVKFPMVEPAQGRRKSQIEEYLAYYRGPGVQHIALLSSDIVETVRALRSTGNEFLRTPDAYYEMLEERVGKVEENMEELREQHILVDRDEWGYLLQIFTKPLQSRPTVFMEAIQRKGARGFGSGNIKALFEALEREQARRGNL
jgi:4-hydroxyphenylpyruvate dioxygenase